MRMKLITGLSLSVLALLCSPALYSQRHNNHNCKEGRHYNCRIPRRDSNAGKHCGQAMAGSPLFEGLGLSDRQCRQADKAYSKYLKGMSEVERKMSRPGHQPDDSLFKEAKRCEDKFLNEMRRMLLASQYRLFESRFRMMCPGMGPQSAPRPGSHNGLGPVKEGPAPTLMTRPGC